MTTIERLTRTGIRRLGSPASGFRYVGTNGRRVGAAELSRNPSVLASFEKGRVIERYFESVEDLLARRARGLGQPEKALFRLLREKSGG